MSDSSLNPTVVTYLVYLALSVALTVWVARTLHRSGRVFLVNLGYVSLALRLGYEVADARGSIEALSQKVGAVLLVLGGMHFFNLYVFSRIRRRARLADAPPPVDPDERPASLPAGA